jgi:hypothetical protein
LLILSPIVGDRESPQSDELNQLMGPDPRIADAFSVSKFDSSVSKSAKFPRKNMGELKTGILGIVPKLGWTLSNKQWL